jgi:hypothetical protein
MAPYRARLRSIAKASVIANRPKFASDMRPGDAATRMARLGFGQIGLDPRPFAVQIYLRPGFAPVRNEVPGVTHEGLQFRGQVMPWQRASVISIPEISGEPGFDDYGRTLFRSKSAQRPKPVSSVFSLFNQDLDALAQLSRFGSATSPAAAVGECGVKSGVPKVCTEVKLMEFLRAW